MKKLFGMIFVLVIMFAFAACGGSKDGQDTTETTGDNATTEAKATYESILEEYSQKLIDATPGLVEEYNAEAAEKAGDVNALAELFYEKVEKLAEINAEGTEKMAGLMLDNGDSQDVYMEWAEKLNDVYMKQAEQITDAHMNPGAGE